MPRQETDNLGEGWFQTAGTGDNILLDQGKNGGNYPIESEPGGECQGNDGGHGGHDIEHLLGHGLGHFQTIFFLFSSHPSFWVPLR